MLAGGAARGSAPRPHEVVERSGGKPVTRLAENPTNAYRSEIARGLRMCHGLDVVDEDLVGKRAYSITVLENYSRAVLSSAVSPTQDLSAFLSVLHRAVARHGPPEALVTDSGSVFRANRAKAVYEALGIRKEEIERGRPWQSYLETAFNVQRRTADHHFAKAESWPELVRAHDRWVEEYNGQYHFAHEERPDGRRTPEKVLGRLREVRRPEDLDRAFFSERSVRVLDPSGYATWRRWRVYGEEGLAGREAALWLREKTLTVEHAGRSYISSGPEERRTKVRDRRGPVGRPATPEAPDQQRAERKLTRWIFCHPRDGYV